MTYKCFLKQLSQYLYETGEYDISLICNNEDEVLKDMPIFVHYHPVDMKRGVSLSALDAIKKIGKILKKKNLILFSILHLMQRFTRLLRQGERKFPSGYIVSGELDIWDLKDGKEVYLNIWKKRHVIIQLL